ncbi:SOS response-associated peptidase [Bartonella tamiae]|uniref:Abasic site processing protein n=1 Tax=Bartonella tamiae Th239 TaxID=1094558 RepID=J0R4Q1_9HYPH|nr:SOS response-associated peptidase [Bartonella tamiae]EJF90644.1 hypothetical protein ME5_01045 [Bartonella tamiae Th239]EJF93979.1 hypothetical protein MEG_00837 [Bartonella tamiae Th307]
MCGRFALNATASDVGKTFDALMDQEFPPRLNISPTQPIIIIKSPEAYRSKQSNLGKYDSGLVRWGFIPSWIKDPNQWPLTVNIRSETVMEKKSFRNALKYHRIIIPATGFYEWKKNSFGLSQPYYIHRKNKSLLGFAGLMEAWSGIEGSQIDTAAILTRQAVPPFSNIHRRMPVMVYHEDIDFWLDWRNYHPSEIKYIFEKSQREDFDIYPISRKINDPHYFGEDAHVKITIDEQNAFDKNNQDNQFSLFKELGK